MRLTLQHVHGGVPLFWALWFSIVAASNAADALLALRVRAG
jgi:hypothetical protein